MDDLVETVRQSLSPEHQEEFDQRVAEQAEAMVADCESGLLDNPEFATGLELEAYVVDEQGRLCAVPEKTYEIDGCDKELGLHNLEIHTPPDALTAEGFERQADTIHELVEHVREDLAEQRRWLVLDGMWAVPPATGAMAYLGATETHDGVVIAQNMHKNSRYHALDNDVLDQAGGSIPLSVPGFSGEFPSILVESLATSIQPHLQIPESADFPEYFNVAIRTAGPVLALTANSPFLPHDLYDFEATDSIGDVDDPHALVGATHHELRIQVFEQSINAGLSDSDHKVRFPRDIEATSDIVRRLVEDETYAPFLADEDPESYSERYPELAHKRGTYWRWVRAVVGGETPRGDAGDEASIRIEYRPIPTQPTATDIVACQALVCGLIRGLVAADHPLTDLPWNDARESFYNAAREGLDAELTWVDADGERTSDAETIFDEVFEYARLGLRESGLEPSRIDELLAPLEARWEARTTPSQWKKDKVRSELDAGADFETAMTVMQRDYVEQALAYDSFADWL